jgi:hypothetical protein
MSKSIRRIRRIRIRRIRRMIRRSVLTGFEPSLSIFECLLYTLRILV